MANQTSPYIAALGKTELEVSVSGGCCYCHLEGSAPLRLHLLPEHSGTSSSALSCAGWICLYLFLVTAHVMHSLNQEIKAFSRNNLRKQCTRVTTLTGKKIIETWKDARIHVVEEVEPSTGGGCGYVQDLSLDLQVGVIKPWLLLGEYVDLSLSPSNHVTFSLFPLICSSLYYQLSCRKVDRFPFLNMELRSAISTCSCSHNISIKNIDSRSTWHLVFEF